RGISLSASSGERQPWHTLQVSDGFIHHFYYALGTDRVDFDDEANRDERSLRLDSVRQLVNLLNHQPTGLARVAGTQWVLRGSAPNWMTVAAQFACGGPAGAPRAESRTGSFKFRFDKNLDEALKATPRGDRAQIVVAILDTAPRGPNFDT